MVDTRGRWRRNAADEMKLRLEVNPEGLAAGEYKATVRIAAPDAFYPVLDLPVLLGCLSRRLQRASCTESYTP